MNVDEVLAKMDALDTNEEEIQYIIDENLRVISIPPLGVVLGVEGDKDVNSAKFKMVRYYKGIDLSKFEIRINFANANGDLSYYTVKNPTVTDDTLTFEWLVGYLVTKYKGTVRFVVRMIITDASTGEVQQAFDTTVGEARSLEGLLVDTPTDEKVYDIVAQLKADLTDHVNNLIETIPDDYSELTQKVEDNTSGISELKEDISNRGIVNGGKNLIGNEADKLYAVGRLPAGTKLTISMKDGGLLTGANLKCYDKTRTYLQYFNAYKDNKRRTFTLDYDTSYIALSKVISDRPMQLEIGEKATEFQEYTPNVAEALNLSTIETEDLKESVSGLNTSSAQSLIFSSFGYYKSGNQQEGLGSASEKISADFYNSGVDGSTTLQAITGKFKNPIQFTSSKKNIYHFK